MPIQDLARSEVVTADLDTPVTDLATKMDEENVGSVVITEGTTPVGIVTDRDLALRVLGEKADPAVMAAEDVMTADLKTAEADIGFYRVAELMAEHGIRRLPVVERDTLVGMITADDLNELLADEQSQFADIIRSQRPAY
jgi:CBS domain-containing protein